MARWSPVVLVLLAFTIGMLFINSSKPGIGSHDLRVVSAASPTKMNMLYIGVDNPLEVVVAGQDVRSIEVAISEGSIEKKGNGLFIARPTKPGTATISISVRKGNREARLVDEKVFRVSRIPDPKVLLGNKQGPVVTAGEVKSMIGLVAIADNFPFDVRFSIRSFAVTHKAVADSVMTEIHNVGGAFSEDVRQQLSQCKAGDRVWFSDIKIAAPDGTTRTADLSFKIVQ
jgi:hypothetical protein